MPPKTGTKFTFNGVADDDGNLRAFGNEPGAVKIGTEVEVVELVSAKTAGAHNDREDAVVVQWGEDALTTADDGSSRVVSVPRRWAVGVGQFDELFTKKGN